MTLSALSLSGSGQRSEQRLHGFGWRETSPGFSPKDEPSHCHHWKHKSVPWTSAGKSRPWSHVRSGEINHGEPSNDLANLAIVDGHNFHPLQCYTDMKVCLHMSRSHKSYEASADIAPRRPALLGRSPWKIQSPAFAESRSHTRASKTGCLFYDRNSLNS